MGDIIKVALISLGCDKNLTDSERLLGYIKAGGLEVTGDKERADVIIVNTCGFIKSAEDESAETLKQCAAANAKIIATGCVAARYAKQGEAVLKEKLPFADRVVLFGEYENIAAIIYSLLNRDGGACGKTAGRVVSTGHYAYIKIAEGCDNRCAYCAIPYIRGKYVSRDFESLVDEAGALALSGVKELIVVAQDTSRYGEDLYGANRLPELLRAFTAIGGIEAVRLMYCYPERVTDELIAEMARNPKICKYLDMPIQHASDSVLSAMGRKGDKALIIETINKLRAAMPDITLRTTLMVGFPNETEADFKELLAFCASVKFDRVGAFMYSREEGTPACHMENQVPENVKKRRYEKLMEETARISKKRRSRFIGQTLKAFAEDSCLRGEHDAPDVDGVIEAETGNGKPETGKTVAVKITGITKYDLTGTIL